MDKLSVNPGMYQEIFEDILREKFGLNKGCFAITQNGDRYVNEHIQWFWEQWNKK